MLKKYPQSKRVTLKYNISYIYWAHYYNLLIKQIFLQKDYIFVKVKVKSEKEVERLEQLLQDTEDKQRQVNNSDSNLIIE